MSSNGYLPIDASESSSSSSHFVRREYRNGTLTFWAILTLVLCGIVILRRRMVFFPIGKENGTAEALSTGTSPLKSHRSKWINKKIKEIAHNETEKTRIRSLNRMIEVRTKCIGRCVRHCNRGTSNCIVSCTTRCMQPFSPSRITKTSQMIQKKVLRIGAEDNNRVLKKAHNGQFEEIGTAYTQYYERRRVHCVWRFCLHIAEFCSMFGKHWDFSCDKDIRQCEIEHCGVDEFCVQVVHDGMENEPIIATMRVLEICLDAGLFYS